jgi:hypothetical protein
LVVAFVPYSLSLNQLPAGYAVSSARPGETVTICTREFVTPEDGDLLTARLEGYPSEILRLIFQEAAVQPSGVEHMLVLVRTDRSAKVYLNELTITAEIQPKRTARAGEPVFENDVADIRFLRFENVEIQDDVGILFVFSFGWRRGFYYDLTPLSPSYNGSRGYDVWRKLGQCWAYLSFQQTLKVTPEEWESLLCKGWFPFIGLSVEHRKQLLHYLRDGWDVDELTIGVSTELRERLETSLASWEGNVYLQPHMPLLRAGAERYSQADYMSCNCILYPRIEGILRSFFHAVNPERKVNQADLIASAIDHQGSERHEASLLLPGMFRRYLEQVSFAKFDSADPAAVSRHSVAHGVVRPDQLSLKAATMAFLTIEQLFYFLRPESRSTPDQLEGKRLVHEGATERQANLGLADG